MLTPERVNSPFLLFSSASEASDTEFVLHLCNFATWRHESGLTENPPSPSPVPYRLSSCPLFSPKMPPNEFSLSLPCLPTHVLYVGSHVVNLGLKLWVITPIMNHHALFRLWSPEGQAAL